MRILVPILVFAAAGCEFGDNRPLPASDCSPLAPCGEADASAREPVDGAAGEPDGGDRADAAEEEACALVEQTGCPAGRACDLDDAHLETGATTCRPIDEDGDASSLCDVAEECGAGFTCVADPAGGSSCMAFCAVEADCPGPAAACDVQLVDDDDQPIPETFSP